MFNANSNSKKSGNCRLTSLILTIVITGIVSVANATYTNLHDFAGGNDDGLEPLGSLTLSEGSFYGMTSGGGDDNNGVIFKIDTDGNNYTNLYDFAGGSGSGRSPSGSLTLSGSSIYGMTYKGGAADVGVIFKIDTGGNNYTNLHEFTDGNTEGDSPYGSLTLSGNSLYGMTYKGGAADVGVIFKIDTDGNNYTNLYEFTEGNTDGDSPYGSLTLSAGSLYGMTSFGGAVFKGVIFKIDTDGNNYTNLHDFAGGNDDGQYPFGSLTFSGSSFYGMTYEGGSTNKGVIFKIDTDGNNYTNLYEFTANDAVDGANPRSSLILLSDSLAGMTFNGGDDNLGVIFQIGIDGNNYTNLHDFAGGNDDGQYPFYNNLLEDNGYLYGMTVQGGDANNGVIFKQLVPEPTILGMLLIGGGIFLKIRKRGI